MDRRVKYTKMVLKNALIELLSENPISKITVKAICEKADVNRSTFYTHYTDQYALLQNLKDELFDNIKAHITSHNFREKDEDLYLITYNVMLYIKDNQKICALLFGENGDMEFQKRVFRILESPFYNGLDIVLGERKTEYVFSYVISGSLGLIQNWLKNNLEEPPEEIAMLITTLARSGMQLYDIAKQKE
jgi:AcrR family transcriptional regulator